MAAAYGFGMYGMFGHAADPVNFERFCQRVKSIDVDIQGSPYRDFDMPDDAVVFVFGASLGANNSPVIVHALNHHRNVDGIFGFQASSWSGAARMPIAPNCAFAHEALNPNRSQHRPRLLPLGSSGPGKPSSSSPRRAACILAIGTCRCRTPSWQT